MQSSRTTTPPRDATTREGSGEELASTPPSVITPHVSGTHETSAVDPRRAAGIPDHSIIATAEGIRRHNSTYRGQQAQVSREQIGFRRAETTVTMTPSAMSTTCAGRVLGRDRQYSLGGGRDNDVDNGLAVDGVLPNAACLPPTDGAGSAAVGGYSSSSRSRPSPEGFNGTVVSQDTKSAAAAVPATSRVSDNDLQRKRP